MSQPRGLTIFNWSTKMIEPSSRCSTRVVSGPEIMYRRGRGYAPASLALVSHSHGILLHDWGASRQSTRLRPMLLSSRPQPGSTSISVCVTKCSSHQGLLFQLPWHLWHTSTPGHSMKRGITDPPHTPRTAYGRPRGSEEVVNQ